ncbi:hypothetical protein DR864_15345 [Runella rosea]|uniref:Uncharacterized protein n=1 Tax=Runella rosea TaxID=2259595 RepID=A0A344TK55_9BACT|nr:hypothetical protein [Runella rosea]AXE19026.1 hypothetical protein DR864_15345 [Runella rosea]
MKINKIHEVTFNTDETIISATVSNREELVLLMSSAGVIRYKINEKNEQYLFSVKSDLYSDGGFDITAQSTIYTLGTIVVVVNDYKRHGYIHYPEKYHVLHLWREDYYADISCYPIALFKNETGVPHIIYGVAWNHVQIMNLDTRQILTAAKSLIEENAEEKHIEFYKAFSVDDEEPWPRPYDYFFGKLHVSPDKRKFLSAGWAWGSCDAYTVYDIEHFINSNRIADVKIGAWNHENRAVCWIDGETVAIAYNPFTEEDENSTADSPCEIHFYKIDGDNAVLEKQIPIIGLDISDLKIYYNKNLNSIIALSGKIGIAIIELDGQIIFQDTNLKVDEYFIETSLFIQKSDKTILVYEINE